MQRTGNKGMGNFNLYHTLLGIELSYLSLKLVTVIMKTETINM